MTYLWNSIPICFLLLALPASAQQPANDTGLPPIQSGCEKDYAPFCLVREDGQADGFCVELLREALKAMHRDVVFKTASWPELKDDLAERRLQVLPMMARTPEREALFDFTFPYLTMHGAIVVRNDNRNIHKPEDLKGKQVAVLREDVAHEYLRRANLGAVLMPLDSFATALKELSEGKHDAVVIQRLLAFQLMNELKLDNLKIVGEPIVDYTQSLCFAVPENDTHLLSLLNEGLSIVIANGRFRSLQTKWFAPLTAIERGRYPIIVGFDSDYPPFEFLDPETRAPAGFNVDLTRAIARLLGLTVEIRMGEWTEIRKKFDENRIDVLPLFFSFERARQYAFSPPHAIVHNVVVLRKNSPPLSDIAALKNKTILLQGGDITHDFALEQGCSNLVAFSSQENALVHLASGEGDCALASRASAIYWIKKRDLRNLTLSSIPVFSSEYCFAAPLGKEALLSDFSEGLEAVKSTGEYRTLQNKWLAPLRPDYKMVLRYSLLVAIPLITLLLASLAWSKSLHSQVIRRTRDLRKEIQAGKAVSRELRMTVSDLARSNSDLEQFAHVASHDLKEPLRMVTGFMSLLKEHSRGKLDEKALEYIALASEGGARMQSLVDDLLAYSRIGRNKEAVPVNANDIMGAVLKNLQASIQESSATVTHDPLPVISGNPTELTQLFQNLVSNAIKFRNNRRPVIHVSAQRQDDHWQFDVSDNGIGIEKQYQERIFMIFQRLHTAEEYPGTGIGLALCKKIVDRHGGRIWLDSTPGAGSVFHFTIPCSDAPPPA